MRLVVAKKLDAAAEQRLTKIVQDALGHAFTIRFSYSEAELPRTTGGKFEEFVCRVAD